MVRWSRHGGAAGRSSAHVEIFLCHDGGVALESPGFRVGGAAGFYDFYPCQQTLRNYDLKPLPIGNVLVIAWERLQFEALGRNRASSAAFIVHIFQQPGYFRMATLWSQWVRRVPCLKSLLKVKRSDMVYICLYQSSQGRLVDCEGAVACIWQGIFAPRAQGRFTLLLTTDNRI